MTNCQLQGLPPPPIGKTGWPWTIESHKVPRLMANGQAWPKISIVTPSYNQGSFIEETIRSVLMQGYPNLEYIIMDGGSSDQTLDVINKYKPLLTHFESKPDRGQSHAINKGMAIGTGEILNWLNSDDFLEEGALIQMAEAFSSAAEGVGAMVGIGHMIDLDKHILRSPFPLEV